VKKNVRLYVLIVTRTLYSFVVSRLLQFLESPNQRTDCLLCALAHYDELEADSFACMQVCDAGLAFDLVVLNREEKVNLLPGLYAETRSRANEAPGAAEILNLATKQKLRFIHNGFNKAFTDIAGMPAPLGAGNGGLGCLFDRGR